MKTVTRASVAFFLAALLLIVLAQGAFAGVVFCSSDLGPMATRAEDTGNIPQPVLDKVVDAPAQAVSTDKGGSNTHK